MKYWEKNDTLITVIILLLIAILLSLYVIDINRSSNYKGTRIGIIQFVVPVATRNHSAVLVWDRLRNNGPLYGSDTVRTESSSEAKIIFDNDLEFNLSGNTMIKLPANLDSGVQDLGKLVNADLVIDSGNAEKEISVDGKTIKLEKGTKIVLRKDKDGLGVVSFEVVEGSISFKDKNDKLIVVSKNHQLDMNIADDVFDVNALMCSLTSPSYNAHIISESKKSNVEFLWTSFTTNKKDVGVVEVAVDRKFENIIYTKTAENKIPFENLIQSTTHISLNPGIFFWRVKFPNGQISSSRKFNLQQYDKLQLVAPKDNSTVKFVSELPVINFSWTLDAAAIAYKLEVSRSNNFTTNVFNKEIESNSISLDVLTEGKYFWRVIPIYPAKSIVQQSDEVSYNTLFIANSDTMYPVDLMYPQNDFVYNSTNFSEKGLNASWNAMNEADEYILNLYRTNNDKIPIHSITTTTSFIKLTDSNTPSAIKDMDSFVWSVQWVNKSGKKSIESEKRTIHNVTGDYFIKSIFPIDGYLMDKSISNYVVLTWKTNIVGKNTFILSTDSNLENVIFKKESDLTSLTCPYLKVGEYYWAVKALDEKTDKIYISDIRKIVVVSAYTAPTLLNPSVDSLITVAKGEDVVIKWENNPNADFYEFTLYGPDGKARVNKPFFDGTEYKYKIGNDKSGVYTVALQAQSVDSMKSSRIIGFRGLYKFDSRVLTPVKQISPSNGRKISELDAFYKRMIFTWGADVVPDSSQLLLERNGKQVPNSELINLSSTSAELLNPIQGKYRWKVKARKATYDVSSRKYFYFEITPIPPLNAPEFKSEIHYIDKDYLKNNKSISCSWSTVKDADYYRVGLYRKGYKKPIMEDTTTKTQYTFNILDKLAKDKFYWQVSGEAIVTIKKRKVVRTGKNAISNFDIVLPQLHDVNIDNSGEYYGY